MHDLWRVWTLQSLPPREDHTRTILHLDLDCFYAQSETLRRPELADKPVVVRQKGIIVTSNYVARSRGVTKLSSLAGVRTACPDAIVINGEDLAPYRVDSANIEACVVRWWSTHVCGSGAVGTRDAAGRGDDDGDDVDGGGSMSKAPIATVDAVERGGLDEFWVDLTTVVAALMTEQSALVEELRCGAWRGYVPPVAVSMASSASSSSSSASSSCPLPHCDCELRTRVGLYLACELQRAVRAATGFTCSCGACAVRVAECSRLAAAKFARGIRGTGGTALPFRLDMSTICLHVSMHARVATSVPASLAAGVSCSKMLSKFAANLRKPNGVSALPPFAARAFIAGYSVRKLPGCGHKFGRQLQQLKVATVGDVRRFPEAFLVQQFGEEGRVVFALAWGCDDRVVKGRGVWKCAVHVIGWGIGSSWLIWSLWKCAVHVIGRGTALSWFDRVVVEVCRSCDWAWHRVIVIERIVVAGNGHRG